MDGAIRKTKRHTHQRLCQSETTLWDTVGEVVRETHWERLCETQ